MKTIERLQEENAALAAQVEVLRQGLCSVTDWFSAYWPDLTQEQKDRLQKADKIAKATPQQHLRELRAEAVLQFLHILEHAPSSPVSAMTAMKIGQWWSNFEAAKRQGGAK